MTGDNLQPAYDIFRCACVSKLHSAVAVTQRALKVKCSAADEWSKISFRLLDIAFNSSPHLLIPLTSEAYPADRRSGIAVKWLHEIGVTTHRWFSGLFLLRSLRGSENRGEMRNLWMAAAATVARLRC